MIENLVQQCPVFNDHEGQVKNFQRYISYGVFQRFLFSSVVFLCPSIGSAEVDLTEMSLESLMDVEVTTVAKQARSLADTAASVYVISSEDIRRSGATTIPEALRLAPGIELANIDGNKTAMAIRGFNSGASSNKLLVLIDGRVVYTALLAGVFWEHQDVLMVDIDRIEVVRGPGATLWGANAVNGVINIITRDATESQGGLVEGIIGTDPIGNQGAMRYGDELGDDAYYRAYLKYQDRGDFRFADGSDANDDREVGQVGGRIDWRPTLRDHVTLQGDVYDGTSRQNVFDAPITFDFGSFIPSSGIRADTGELNGGNVLFRWQRVLESGGEMAWQFYYDRLEREDIIAPHRTDTFDIDFQHGVELTDQVDVLWGLGYRHVRYDFQNLPNLQLTPDSQGLDTFSSFIQAAYAITDNLEFALGSKFEHNDFTGVEYQPSARIHWHPAEDHTLWGAVSRAVRTPAVFDAFNRTDFLLIRGLPPFIPPSLFSLFGNDDLESEDVVAYEAGYRAQLRRDLSADLSVFYNVYDNLINFEPAPVPVFEPPNLLFRSDADNRLHGETYGLEATAEWWATDNWRLVGGYSITKMSIHADAASLDTFSAPGIEINSPEQQFQVRSYLDLTSDIEFDISLFWVDRLPGDAQLFTQEVDDYLKLDLHLGWRPDNHVSLDLFLQNLLNDHNAEFRDGNVRHSEIPRALFGRVRLDW